MVATVVQIAHTIGTAHVGAFAATASTIIVIGADVLFMWPLGACDGIMPHLATRIKLSSPSAACTMVS